MFLEFTFKLGTALFISCYVLFLYMWICYFLDLKEDDDTGMKKLENLVQDLPHANFNTLKFIRYFHVSTCY